MKARILSPAVKEIVDAALWYDSQRLGLAEQFWLAVDSVLVRIEDNPLGFARSEFATADQDIRYAVVRQFHYVIHFFVGVDEVQILSVAHAARRPGYWLERLNTRE